MITMWVDILKIVQSVGPGFYQFKQYCAVFIKSYFLRAREVSALCFSSGFVVLAVLFVASG